MGNEERHTQTYIADAGWELVICYLYSKEDEHGSIQLRIASLIVSQLCRYQPARLRSHPSATPTLFLASPLISVAVATLVGPPLQKPVQKAATCRDAGQASTQRSCPGPCRISCHWLHWLGTDALTRLCVAALFFFLA